MGNWTIESVVTGLGLLVAFISGVVYLKKHIKDWIEEFLDKKFEVLSEKIDAVENKVDKVDLETCKNFLVRLLADVERGDYIADPEKQRFWEEYEHYTDEGGNSYIKEWVEKLRRAGKL